MKPTIGIVTCGFEKERQFVSQAYISAIERSGGIPILLPSIKEQSDQERFAFICDGFLFCGGDDITPLIFGEELHTSKGQTDIKTDIFQLSFMEYALLSGKPVLGICRGMQVLNVALGGTIYQDLSLKESETLQHMQLSQNRSDVSHKVTFKKDSILYKICGKSANTNSFHHQAIHKSGRKLFVSGFTSDQVAESIESTEHPFAVGVQWHPECMYDTSPEMQSLFLVFITASACSMDDRSDSLK